jgi:hypothetical protein
MNSKAVVQQFWHKNRDNRRHDFLGNSVQSVQLGGMKIEGFVFLGTNFKNFGHEFRGGINSDFEKEPWHGEISLYLNFCCFFEL